jgi:hypothetical protein
MRCGPSTDRRDLILKGFSTPSCFPRIALATCANDVPLQSVTDRSEPMACGPNVDQRCRSRLWVVRGIAQAEEPPPRRGLLAVQLASYRYQLVRSRPAR